jgi:hypothetical protein
VTLLAASNALPVHVVLENKWMEGVYLGNSYEVPSSIGKRREIRLQVEDE